jgi:cation diffusion facilitator CzcD-associated flavoprotein CzcO
VAGSDSPDASRLPAGSDSPDFHTVIVGAGFSGIGAAIQLDRAGLGDYLIIEAANEPGGTWYWNTYPGIAVDIPSFSYQFSFEQARTGPAPTPRATS